jgi:hypothetical protein
VPAIYQPRRLNNSPLLRRRVHLDARRGQPPPRRLCRARSVQPAPLKLRARVWRGGWVAGRFHEEAWPPIARFLERHLSGGGGGGGLGRCAPQIISISPYIPSYLMHTHRTRQQLYPHPPPLLLPDRSWVGLIAGCLCGAVPPPPPDPTQRRCGSAPATAHAQRFSRQSKVSTQSQHSAPQRCRARALCAASDDIIQIIL